MSNGKCEKDDCTVAETGTCLLHAEPSACPHFRSESDRVEDDEGTAEEPSEKVADEPTPSATRSFHSGSVLGTQDAAKIMRATYAHLIGILGAINVGKTCFLSSLYLLATHGDLRPRFLFAGSLTLRGFEERARRLRKWEGGVLPNKLADHTIRADPRSPALLHLRLQYIQHASRRVDLLLTDLPGEWTSELVDRADTAGRLAFLRRADGIIVVIDGPLLAAPETGHLELHRAKILLQRLSDNVGVDRTTPLVLLLSKCDLLDMQAPQRAQELHEYASSQGYAVDLVLAAAFSTKPTEIASGTGVLETVEIILDKSVSLPSPQASPTVAATRLFQQLDG